jgi:hypothetical protein
METMARNSSPRFAYLLEYCLLILLNFETEIHKIKENSKIERQNTSIAAV